MSKKDPKETGEHMGATRGKAKKAIIIVILLALVGATILAVVIMMQKKQQSVDKPTLQSTTKQADELDKTASYSAQQKLYQNYLKDNPNDTKAMQKLAAALVNDGKYDEAIKFYEDSAKMDATKKLASLHGIADVYIVQGNKAKAVEYLKLAIAEMKAHGDQSLELQINSDEAAIRGLEKK